MKTRLLFSIFLFSVILTQAQLEWMYTDLLEPKSYMGSTSLGSKLYYAGGSDGYYSQSSAETYDVVTETWNAIGNLSVAREVIAGVSCGTNVFFAGGFDWAVSYDIVDIYNTETQEWKVEHLSVPRFSMAAVSHGDSVIFAGGFQFPQQVYWDLVDIYDIQTEEWTTLNLSVAREGIAAAVVGDLAIFAGGKNFQGTTDLVEIYNFTNDEWETANLSQARGFASATTVGSKVIIAGGITSLHHTTDRVDIYDATTDTWDTAHLSFPRASQGNATTVLGKAYFAGGGNFMGSGFYAPSNVVDIYDPEYNTWTVDYLIQPILAHSVLNVGDYLIVAGGEDDEGNAVTNVSKALGIGVGIQDPSVGNSQIAVSSFPNPSNGIFNLKFTIYGLQSVNLRIYDVRGKEVAVVLDQEMAAGEQTVDWDASGLPSGVYFYRLAVGGQQSAVNGKVVKY